MKASSARCRALPSRGPCGPGRGSPHVHRGSRPRGRRSLLALFVVPSILGATLGLIVLAFQQGWLDPVFDYQGPAAIEVISLVFLFSVIFGLATDYAVLVLARIKEVHDAGASNEEAVATGIARTGRVIHRGRRDDRGRLPRLRRQPGLVHETGRLRHGAGVLIDGTIVRALLVPSFMRLCGEWNWWAPRPLRRLYWRIGLSET